MTKKKLASKQRERRSEKKIHHHHQNDNNKLSPILWINSARETHTHTQAPCLRCFQRKFFKHSIHLRLEITSSEIWREEILCLQYPVTPVVSYCFVFAPFMLFSPLIMFFIRTFFLLRSPLYYVFYTNIFPISFFYVWCSPLYYVVFIRTLQEHPVFSLAVLFCFFLIMWYLERFL